VEWKGSDMQPNTRKQMSPLAKRTMVMRPLTTGGSVPDNWLLPKFLQRKREPREAAG